METTDILDGFEIVPAHNAPAIRFDNHFRLYINIAARRLLDVKPYDRLALAYRPATQEIALIKAGAQLSGRLKTELATSVFPVDKRYYLHVRSFAKIYGFDADAAPIEFVYSRGASDGNIFVFKLRD